MYRGAAHRASLHPLGHEHRSPGSADPCGGGHPLRLVARLACIVPGVPNGIIPYVAEQAHITGRNYTKAVAATAWLQILTHCLCGHFLIREKYLTAVLIYGTQIAVLAVIAWKRDVILGRLS